MSLKYWGEPEIVFAAMNPIEWHQDKNVVLCERPKTLGYLPVYTDIEIAMEENPGCKIAQIIVHTEDMQ